MSEPSQRMPVLFVGHGNPMNAIEENSWSEGFRRLGALVPRPRAILAVSAHWLARGTLLTADERPETIHDFGGFPRPLYEIQYPAPGDPALARRTAALLGAERAPLSTEWGLDHGTWSVLLHMYPAADVPVVQLALDARRTAAEHLALGRELAPLRDEGVLLLASGNATHNLAHAFRAWSRGETETPGWAASFDADVARALEAHDEGWLAGALEREGGRLAHPTPDHYWPLLYAAGASAPGERVTYPITGFDMGSLSMRAALFG
jgi:4,5-DOPA dioxygenase extradiol